MLAWSLICQQRYAEALPELERVLADEPRHSYALPNMAHVLYVTGEAGRSVPLYRRVLQQIEDGTRGGSVDAAARDLALALADSGAAGEARELAATHLDRLQAKAPPATSWEHLFRSQLATLAGRRDEAERLVERAIELGIDSAIDEMGLAEAESLLGRTDAALEAIERSYASGYRDPYLPWITPSLRPLHEVRRAKRSQAG
jgi:tetratricopeptide (TPR) repeat protein